jgi:hypothetical protein
VRSPERRRVSWTLLRQTTLLWAAVYAAAAALDRLHWVLSPRGLAEALCWLVVLTLLAAVPAVARFVTSLGPGHKRLVAGVTGALLLGQLVVGAPAFPLVMWRMFSGQIHRLGPFDSFRYVGDTETGGRVPLSPPRLFSSLDAYRMANGLSDLVERAVAPQAPAGPAEQARDRARLDGVLIALGRAHAAAHPDERVRRVGVERCRFEPARAPGGAVAGCARIWTADVPPLSR